MKFNKARKRGIPYKIDESSALEMIFEYGEQAISRKLDQCISSRAVQLENLLFIKCSNKLYVFMINYVQVGNNFAAS